MDAQYRIIVSNLSYNSASFYAFQQKAEFNGLHAPTVYSNCLATGVLAPKDASGAQLVFGFDLQNHVGAMYRNTPRVNSRVVFASDSSGYVVSQSMAARPISLTGQSAPDSMANHSTLSINPLALSVPTHQAGLKAGTFGLRIPVFAPGPVEGLVCGCAVIGHDGIIILSSFVAPLPNMEIECAPAPIFFIRVGMAEVGQRIEYDTAQAAICDFTAGAAVIEVQYRPDGTFAMVDTS